MTQFYINMIIFITLISRFMLHKVRVSAVNGYFVAISKTNKTRCFYSGHLISIYIINTTLHGRIGRRILSSRADIFSHSFAVLTPEGYYQNSKIKSVSPWGHVISSLIQNISVLVIANVTDAMTVGWNYEKSTWSQVKKRNSSPKTMSFYWHEPDFFFHPSLPFFFVWLWNVWLLNKSCQNL